MKNVLSLLLSLYFVSGICTFEPFSITAAVAITSVIAYKTQNQILNYFGIETCSKPWIKRDITQLEQSLKQKLYGQNMATTLILRLISNHIFNENPPKPLVLSLHGWTGCGKTYTSLLTAESLYKLGPYSKNVHVWIGSLHFANPSLTHVYIDQIKNWITGNTSRCQYQLIIIDEVDFISSAIIDSMKPYLDYNPNINGIDFRKNIYIFLSNAGGSDITKLMLKYSDMGMNRDDLDWSEFSKLISQKVFNEKGGLWHSSLIDKYLIDMYIPFLPLEISHVKLCARDYLNSKINQLTKRHGSDFQFTYIPNEKEQKELIDNLTHHLTYYPPERSLYSVSGCKRISIMLDLLLSELTRQKNPGH